MLFVPINVRKIYNSISLRNATLFSRTNCNIANGAPSIDECAVLIKETLARDTAKDVLDRAINTVNNIRLL